MATAAPGPVAILNRLSDPSTCDLVRFQTSTRGKPGNTFSSVIGKSRTRTPVALNTAFTTAALAPQLPSSPSPLAPSSLAHSRRLLAEGKSAIWVAYECGFADQSHLSRRFKECYGLTPSAFQTQYRAQRSFLDLVDSTAA
jgi:hypothetical protein